MQVKNNLKTHIHIHTPTLYIYIYIVCGCVYMDMCVFSNYFLLAFFNQFGLIDFPLKKRGKKMIEHSWNVS